jgi:RNA polymerase sigma-70 factor (ECF subfamily)
MLPGMSPDFARQITESQGRLYAYIRSLVGSSSTAWDILQETNIVLWKKQNEFRPGSSFEAWSYTVARFQVLAFLRDRNREPLSVLTPELLDAFGADAETEASRFHERLAALRHCRGRLAAKSRRLIDLHYDQGLPLAEVAARIGSNANAVKQALFRVRKSLLDCIRSTVPST